MMVPEFGVTLQNHFTFNTYGRFSLTAQLL